MIPSTVSLSVPRLRFESEDDEREFDLASQPARFRHFILSGWVSLIIYNGFLIVDWLVNPNVFALGSALRLGVFTSFGLATLLVAMVFRRVFLALPSVVTEITVLASGLLAALSIAVVLTSPVMGQGPWAVFYHGGFVPVIIYGTVVQRLRFKMAAGFTATIVVIHWVCMAVSYRDASAPVVPMLLFISSMAGYTLIINYRLEYEERQQFLRHQRAKVLSQQLDRSRIELEKAARSDPLTGAANRRAFDEAMQTAWALATTNQSAVSVLLVDVDHFKAYNDFYGHPAGDQCLRHVAQALQGVMRTEGGLVARWGGEEFAIVLPAHTLPRALDLANRARMAVQSANLRHERSSTATSVTISVGVASTIPAQGDVWMELLAQADAALYEAKRAGRNRASAAGPRQQVAAG